MVILGILLLNHNNDKNADSDCPAPVHPAVSILEHELDASLSPRNVGKHVLQTYCSSPLNRALLYLRLFRADDNDNNGTLFRQPWLCQRKLGFTQWRTSRVVVLSNNGQSSAQWSLISIRACPTEVAWKCVGLNKYLTFYIAKSNSFTTWCNATFHKIHSQTLNAAVSWLRQRCRCCS